MTEIDIMAKLEEVFKDVFDLPEVTLTSETTADEIDEWDSVNHIMLVVEIERQFGVKFHTAEIEEMKNVGDLAKLIKAKLPATA